VGPYMRTFQGVMVTTTSPIKSRGDLDHRSVCVAEDTTSSKALAAYAAAHPVDMRTEATTEQCIKNMKTGKYDAVTGDYITLQTNAHSDATLRPLPSIRLSDGYELYGIALPKDSRALCEKLKPFLKDFIREKWEPAFASNLQPLGITYDPTNSNVPSLKPGENLIDINSCKG
jgi:ABC-type amino acid transport substrate-binding protein